MLLKEGQFGFVYDLSKVVALQIVVRNMLFRSFVVAKMSENSQENPRNILRVDDGFRTPLFLISYGGKVESTSILDAPLKRETIEQDTITAERPAVVDSG